MKSISKFRGQSPGEFFSWVLHIAYTTLIDHLRYQAPIERFEDLTWEPSYTEEKQKDLIDLEVVDVTKAIELLDNKEKTPEEIEIEDSVNLVSTLITSLELEDSAELTQSQFAKEYKKIVATHGFKVAKQFADTLKNKHKIK